MFFRVILAIALFTGVSQISNAQRVFVKIQPVAPVEVRVAPPSPRHIWIDGEWEWRGGTYVHLPGHWVIPEPHRHWVPGHWRRLYGGWNWVPGHWGRI